MALVLSYSDLLSFQMSCDCYQPPDSKRRYDLKRRPHKVGSPVHFVCKQTPERALLCALIHRSLMDAQSSNQYQRDEALAWLQDDTIEPFTFLWCCQEMDIDPKQFLSLLQKPLSDIASESNPEHLGSPPLNF
jgi:hypothetical protein